MKHKITAEEYQKKNKRYQKMTTNKATGTQIHSVNKIAQYLSNISNNNKTLTHQKIRKCNK